jgi:small subunit ribosomal protein S16
VGKKKQPMYRLVVTDARAPRDGAFVEIIGRYNPLTEPATLEIDKEKALSWISRGAQPSEAAAKLLARQGIIEKAEKVEKAEKAGRAEKAAKAERAEKAVAEKAEKAVAEKAEKAVAEKAEEAEEPEKAEKAAT